MMRIQPTAHAALWILVMTLVSGCGGTASGGGARPAAEGKTAASQSAPAAKPVESQPQPREEQPIKIGSQLAGTDLGYFIGIDRGYFKQEGIAAEIERVGNASEMIPLLSTGKIDVAGIGANAAGLNALRRGVDIRLVADKSSYKPGLRFRPLLIRKDLYDSGRYKRIEDLKGLKIAFTPPGKGTTDAMIMDLYLRKFNMSVDDFEIVSINFPDQASALANKVVDGSMSLEPYATNAIKNGYAVPVSGLDEMFPNFTNGLISFSQQLYGNRDLAVRTARAYVRAIRDYNRAISKDVSDSDRRAINEIISKYTKVDVGIVAEMQPVGFDDYARINKQSLKDSHAWFLQQGFLEGPVENMDRFFGDDVLEEAIRTLRPGQ
ncbi:MAG: ABC transporter substrate-binding protein [Chloroflexi bacterium]|nr:ABC transporter substrate-binding protein [Chloroflexota bacterium]